MEVGTTSSVHYTQLKVGHEKPLQLLVKMREEKVALLRFKA